MVAKVELYNDKIITLRSVYDKAGIKYYIQPCKDKKGQYPPCIKKVDSNGDMIMSEKEKNEYSTGALALFPENHMFEIVSGKTYNLDNVWDKAEWEAIKNCPLIAPSRDAKDSNGNLIIDGSKPTIKKPARYGVAELYIDRPGLEVQKRVSRKKLIFEASSLIYNDSKGVDGRLMKAELLGKDMSNQSDADVTDFLIRVAEKDPDKIINIYNDESMSIRLLFIHAKKKGVIRIKDKLFQYGEAILGATEDAAVNWMKDPSHKKVVDMISKETYPEFYKKED